MKKKVLIAVTSFIIAIPLILHWYTTSEDAYEKDMDAIQKMIELSPDRISGSGYDVMSDIETVRVITKEAKHFKELYLKLFELRIERHALKSEMYGVMQVGAEPRIAEIDTEMEQHMGNLHEYLEDFIEAAEDADVGDYSLEKFIEYIY